MSLVDLIAQADERGLAASGLACSNENPGVSTGGQETVKFSPERSTESVGSPRR